MSCPNAAELDPQCQAINRFRCLGEGGCGPCRYGYVGSAPQGPAFLNDCIGTFCQVLLVELVGVDCEAEWCRDEYVYDPTVNTSRPLFRGRYTDNAIFWDLVSWRIGSLRGAVYALSEDMVIDPTTIGPATWQILKSPANVVQSYRNDRDIAAQTVVGAQMSFRCVEPGFTTLTQVARVNSVYSSRSRILQSVKDLGLNYTATLSVLPRVPLGMQVATNKKEKEEEEEEGEEEEEEEEEKREGTGDGDRIKILLISLSLSLSLSHTHTHTRARTHTHTHTHLSRFFLSFFLSFFFLSVR